MNFEFEKYSDGEIRKSLRVALVELGFGGDAEFSIERGSGVTHFRAIGETAGQYRGAFSEDRGVDCSPEGAR